MSTSNTLKSVVVESCCVVITNCTVFHNKLPFQYRMEYGTWHTGLWYGFSKLVSPASSGSDHCWISKLTHSCNVFLLYFLTQRRKFIAENRLQAQIGQVQGRKRTNYQKTRGKSGGMGFQVTLRSILTHTRSFTVQVASKACSLH